MKRYAAILLCIMIAGAARGQTTFAGRLVLQPDWNHEKASGSSTLKETFAAFLDWSHTTGNSTNQMETIIVDTFTLTNAQTRTINLASVVNGFGDTINFATVRFLALTCPTSNVDNVIMGNASTNQFSTWAGGTNHTINVHPGGANLFVAPDATGYTIGSNPNLRLANGGTNNATYSLYVGGSE